jgi:hypothetical protein
VNNALRLVLFLVLSIGVVGISLAQTSSCTTPEGVRVGFFNGVNNSFDDAEESAQQLLAAYGTVAPNGATIKYEVYYNTSQGLASDLLEVFEQRLREQDSIFATKFFLFHEAVAGGGKFTDAIKAAVPAFAVLLDGFNESKRARYTVALSELVRLIGDVSNIEENTFLVHVRQMNEVVRAGNRFLLVAHSQGNLFANRAFEYYKTRAPANTARVVHVAPASLIMNGPWTLANYDFVINGLRLLGSGVPANTTDIDIYAFRPRGLNNRKDPAGHGLLEIYLNPALETRARIDEHINRAIAELSTKDAFDTATGPCVKVTRIACYHSVSGGLDWQISGVARASNGADKRFNVVEAGPMVSAGQPGISQFVASLLVTQSRATQCTGEGWIPVLGRLYDSNYLGLNVGPFCGRDAETGSASTTTWSTRASTLNEWNTPLPAIGVGLFAVDSMYQYGYRRGLSGVTVQVPLCPGVYTY